MTTGALDQRRRRRIRALSGGGGSASQATSTSTNTTAHRLLELPGFPPGLVAGLERRIERPGDTEDLERMLGDAPDGVPAVPTAREDEASG